MPTRTPHERLVQAIIRSAHRNGKFYVYDDTSPLDEPIAWFFQHSTEGLILFVILRTLPCAYNGCTFCRLPGTSTLRQVDFRDINTQISKVFGHADVQARKDEIAKIIVSNQGSILDERTFSPLSLMHLVVQAETHFANLEVICGIRYKKDGI